MLGSAPGPVLVPTGLDSGSGANGTGALWADMPATVTSHGDVARAVLRVMELLALPAARRVAVMAGLREALKRGSACVMEVEYGMLQEAVVGPAGAEDALAILAMWEVDVSDRLKRMEKK